MATIIEIIANNVPAILIVIGFLIYTMNYATGRDPSFGMLLIIMGIILQIFWLFTRRGRRGRGWW